FAKPSSTLYIPTSSTPFFLPQATHSLPHALRRPAVGSSSPHGYLRPSGPRAANSHSASVGRRLPCSLQKSSDISQSTQLMGCCPRRSGARRLQSGSNVLRSLSLMPCQSLLLAAGLHFPAPTHAE